MNTTYYYIEKSLKNSKKLVLFFLLVFGSFYSSACVWTTTGVSTNWTSPAAWTSSGGGCSGMFPSIAGVTAGDEVRINHPINLISANFLLNNAGGLKINSGGSLTLTGNFILQDGSTFVMAIGTTLAVGGNFINNTNENIGNPDEVVIDGIVTVGGNLTSGSGSVITSPAGTGCFIAQGAINGDGTVFGSTADCQNTAAPCITCAISPLPIELLSISAECTSNGVLIQWETASENNNSYFSLSRSFNGYEWEEVSIIPGAGNSNELLSYTVLDNRYSNGINYYQLKQVDFDGVSEQFDVLVVECDNRDGINSLLSYPNPSEGVFKLEIINSTIDDEADIFIIDAWGRMASVQKVNISNGSNTFFINETTLEPGVYQIYFSTENFTSEIIKHIIQ